MTLAECWKNQGPAPREPPGAAPAAGAGMLPLTASRPGSSVAAARRAGPAAAATARFNSDPSLISSAAFQVRFGKSNKLTKPQKKKIKPKTTRKVQFVFSGQEEAFADLLLDGVQLGSSQRVQQLLGDLVVPLFEVGEESPELLLHGCPGPQRRLPWRTLQDLLQALQLSDGDVLVRHKVYHGLLAVVVS